MIEVTQREWLSDSEIKEYNGKILYFPEAVDLTHYRAIFEKEGNSMRCHMRSCSSGIMIFKSKEDKEKYELFLKQNNFKNYSYEIPFITELVPQKVKYSKGNFDNTCSMVGFIGNYDSVDEVIKNDSDELKQLGGSFEEIADCIEEFLILSKNYKMDFKLNEFLKENIYLINYHLTKGSQYCPFGCNKDWSEIIIIKNIQTEKELTINKGILHLVREHNLLEKGNEYGITAKEFYEHFINGHDKIKNNKLKKIKPKINKNTLDYFLKK